MPKRPQPGLDDYDRHIGGHTLMIGVAGTTSIYTWENAPIPEVGEAVTLNNEDYRVAARQFTFREERSKTQPKRLWKPLVLIVLTQGPLPANRAR